MAGKKRPVLYLVDGYNLIFRAFFAIRHLSADDGTPTNAVFGTTRMILKLIKEKDPSHIAVIFDAGGKNFRHELYPEYKANRPEAPEELKVQFPLVRELVEALALPTIVKEGVEADDVIGTLATRAAGKGFDVIIVSGDKDMMQLIDEHVSLYDTMREMVYDPAGVKKKLGVPPEQVIDLLALQGDSSDNIPGVTKIGPKTAAKLLGEHENLEAVLDAAEGMKKSKMRERLLEEADQARLSYKLATIDRNVELDLVPDELTRQEPDAKELDSLLARLGFSALRRELSGKKKSIDTGSYTTVRDRQVLEKVIARARKAGECAVDLETTSLDAMRAEVVGVSLCPAEGEAVYIPVAHTGTAVGKQLDRDEVIGALRELIKGGNCRIYGQNFKYDSIVLANRHDLRPGRIACDSMIASYVLDPGRSSHGLDALALEMLGHETITYTDVAGKGKKQIPFAEVPIERATAYAAEDADVTFRLCKLLLPRVEEQGLQKLFEEIELELAPVLVDMELCGVRVDRSRFEDMQSELEGQIEKLTGRIHLLAGREFNINSPVQLREILFDEMGFEVKKKTKSGPSTDSTVLEELASLHELPAEILNYRSLTKLKSTYVDVLPEMINPQTGCIHTSYNQTVAATGRLSSSDPNLQNIPVRTDTGRRIREAFIASDGNLLMSADYSQVELRILAHLSGDDALLEAFRHGEDIHARTAARVFDTRIDSVDSDMRAKAKAVNFGIVYGQGPYNLARQLRISRTEAKEIIDSYNNRYPRVRQWVEEIHEKARAEKQVTTLFGRRRSLPDINSSNFNVRSNAERIAQNTIIQGTAADIIKLAMVSIHGEMKKRKMEARMVLQVHDELLFDVPEDEVDLLETLVREKMESAASLQVALTVDISTGDSWAEAH